MAEMFAVAAMPAALLHPIAFRQGERRLIHNAGDRLEPLRLQGCWINGDAGVDETSLGLIDFKHFAGEGPEIVDRHLSAAVALVGPVAEPDDPFRGMAQMIGAFLFR